MLGLSSGATCGRDIAFPFADVYTPGVVCLYGVTITVDFGMPSGSCDVGSSSRIWGERAVGPTIWRGPCHGGEDGASDVIGVNPGGGGGATG